MMKMSRSSISDGMIKSIFGHAIQRTESMSDATNYKLENERYLLNIIKTQLGITDEDMQSKSIVKAKVREAIIDKVLEK